MAMRLTPYLLALSALSPGGCGTAINVACRGDGNAEPLRVYGGIQRDVEAATVYFNEPHAEEPHVGAHRSLQYGRGAFCLADLPFSAIGDTLTLPVTIPCTLWRAFERIDMPPTSDDDAWSAIWFHEK